MAIAPINDRILRIALRQLSSKIEFLDLGGRITWPVYSANGVMNGEMAVLIEPDPSSLGRPYTPHTLNKVLPFYATSGGETVAVETAIEAFEHSCKILSNKQIMSGAVGIPEDYPDRRLASGPVQIKEDPRVAALQTMVRGLQNELSDAQLKASDLRQDIMAALIAFAQYARHSMRCSTGTQCDCGYDGAKSLLDSIHQSLNQNSAMPTSSSCGVQACG